MLERRLLTPKGAGGFPLVLGNDVDGIVEDRGPGVTRFTAGTAVAVGRRVCWFLAAFFGAGLLVVVLSAPWLLR
jgi:NADPH:quinone reductase-like Zn-dependent oxidoreductase